MFRDWRLKAILQFILSIFPKGEKLNYMLQKLYRGSDFLRNPAIQKESFNLLKQHAELSNAIAVEIGTGWIPYLPLLLASENAIVHTYDHVKHIREEMVESAARKLGVSAKLWSRVEYHAPADVRSTGLPDKSVDVVCSHSVLEHIPYTIIEGIVRETKRILKPGGICFHHVACNDHFTQFDKKISNINYLKYPDWLWAILSQNKIQYLNRMRCCQFINLFQQNGAQILFLDSQKEIGLVNQASSMRLAKQFKNIPISDLIVTAFSVVYTH